MLSQRGARGDAGPPEGGPQVSRHHLTLRVASLPASEEEVAQS